MVIHLCIQDFAGKLGSLRKALKSRAELIFVEAPHAVDGDQSVSETCVGGPRAWWTWQVSFLEPAFDVCHVTSKPQRQTPHLHRHPYTPCIHLVMPL